MKDSYYCLDCKRIAEVVVDEVSGDTVCIECGLVSESFWVDTRPEWRVFSDNDDGADPNRVGAATNPLLDDGPLQTMVKTSKGTTRGDFPTSRLRLGLGAPTTSYRNLTRGFEGIADMCDKLGLLASIQNRASEIFKKVEDKKASCRFNNREALLAASLYIACKQEGKNRTLKEICSASNGGLTIRDIGRAEKYIAKQVPDMEVGVPVNAQSGSVLMTRFGSHLGLKYPAIKAAQETVGKSNELLDIRRNPVSIAAAVIYMVSQLSDDKKSLQDVSFATGVAQGTIRDSYKDLQPHLSKIVPSWFMTQTLKV